jgi:hypothetical protein
VVAEVGVEHNPLVRNLQVNQEDLVVVLQVHQVVFLPLRELELVDKVFQGEVMLVAVVVQLDVSKQVVLD